MIKPLENPPQECQWFLLCDNEATVQIEHPILPDVPACQRCADKYVELGGAS